MLTIRRFVGVFNLYKVETSFDCIGYSYIRLKFDVSTDYSEQVTVIIMYF